jgi:hypothetical protein
MYSEPETIDIEAGKLIEDLPPCRGVTQHPTVNGQEVVQRDTLTTIRVEVPPHPGRVPAICIQPRIVRALDEMRGRKQTRVALLHHMLRYCLSKLEACPGREIDGLMDAVPSPPKALKRSAFESCRRSELKCMRVEHRFERSGAQLLSESLLRGGVRSRKKNTIEGRRLSLQQSLMQDRVSDVPRSEVEAEGIGDGP